MPAAKLDSEASNPAACPCIRPWPSIWFTFSPGSTVWLLIAADVFALVGIAFNSVAHDNDSSL